MARNLSDLIFRAGVKSAKETKGDAKYAYGKAKKALKRRKKKYGSTGKVLRS